MTTESEFFDIDDPVGFRHTLWEAGNSLIDSPKYEKLLEAFRYVFNYRAINSYWGERSGLDDDGTPIHPLTYALATALSSRIRGSKEEIEGYVPIDDRFKNQLREAFSELVHKDTPFIISQLDDFGFSLKPSEWSFFGENHGSEWDGAILPITKEGATRRNHGLPDNPCDLTMQQMRREIAQGLRSYVRDIYTGLTSGD